MTGNRHSAISPKKETKVILVGGKKRSGKDFVSDLIKRKLESFDKSVETIAFADEIKTILCTTLGITLEQFNDFKNNDETISFSDKTITFRNLIQNFGTDAMQTSFGKFVWRNKVMDFIEETDADYVIVTDFRFPAEYIESFTVNIVNEEIQTSDKHVSENSMDSWQWNYIIDNTGQKPIEEINKHIDEMTKL